MRSTPRVPLYSGLTYHIFNQGNNRENIFLEEKNYEYFLRKYREFILPIASTYAYCLLPNHFHIIVKFKNYEALHNFKPSYFPPPPKGIKNKYGVSEINGFNYDKIVSQKLSRQFANFFGGYTTAINNAYNRRGKLFSLPFERVIVDNEVYFEWLICYLHRNPIHHNFCDDFNIWPYSSYHEIANHLKASGVSVRNTNTAVGSPICDLVFLSDWFGNFEQFNKTHRDSAKQMLNRKYWLE